MKRHNFAHLLLVDETGFASELVYIIPSLGSLVSRPLT